MTEAAYLALRADIVSCRLKPGTRVKISDLCNQIGANLSAVREALARLLADGLVVSEPQKGFQISPISVKDLEDLANTRIEIEILSLRRAMANSSIEWETQMVAAFHRLSRTSEHADDSKKVLNEAFLTAAFQLFEAIMSACDNEWLLRLRRQLYTQYERYRRLTLIGQLGRRDHRAEFKGLLDAILAGNLELAEDRLRDMITPTPEFIEGLVPKAQASHPRTGRASVKPRAETRRKTAKHA
jgi:DNA-binding GntR family transcriptional regulator